MAPSLPKFPLFPSQDSLADGPLDDQPQTGSAAPSAAPEGTQRRRAAKQAPSVGNDVLTKREADTIRPWLVAALQDLSGDLDKLLTQTNAAGAVADIWQLDQMEAEALADMWIRRAMASAVVAVFLRQSMAKYAYYQAGIILFPRFWQTWGFYAGNGFDIPLPGAVRERRARRQRRGQQPPAPAPSRSASGGPAAVLPAAAGVIPQARAAAATGPVNMTTSPAAAAAPVRQDLAQDLAEERYLAHRRAVAAATDSAGAVAAARANALSGLPEALQAQEAQEAEGAQP